MTNDSFFWGFVTGCISSALTYLLLFALSDFQKYRKRNVGTKKKKFSLFDEEDNIF